jgi:hypothetical protein
MGCAKPADAGARFMLFSMEPLTGVKVALHSIPRRLFFAKMPPRSSLLVGRGAGGIEQALQRLQWHAQQPADPNHR